MGDTFFMRLYTKEFLADSKVRALSREHRADLVDLWCHCDQEGSIPADAVAVGRLLGLPPATARRSMEALKVFFREDEAHPGRLFSPRHRLEREARDAEAAGHRRGAQTTNEKRWGKRGGSESPSDRSATGERVAEGSPVISQQSVQPANAGCGAETPAAPRLLEEPSVFLMPCRGVDAQPYGVTQRQVDDWTTAYPGVDVLQELHKAKAWLEAVPTRGKTRAGMARFLVGWLGRAQDSAVSRPPARAAPGGAHRGIAADQTFQQQLSSISWPALKPTGSPT